ncbi:MAG: hypothetical protein AAF628_19970 [Planctomycetota bacterium]
MATRILLWRTGGTVAVLVLLLMVIDLASSKPPKPLVFDLTADVGSDGVPGWFPAIKRGGRFQLERRSPANRVVSQEVLETRQLLPWEAVRLAEKFWSRVRNGEKQAARERLNARIPQDWIAHAQTMRLTEKRRACIDALQRGDVFVLLQGDVPKLPAGWRSIYEWFPWRDPSNSALVIALELSRYPDLQRWEQEEASLQQYVDTEWLANFNGQPRALRRGAWEESERAKAELLRLSREYAKLEDALAPLANGGVADGEPLSSIGKQQRGDAVDPGTTRLGEIDRVRSELGPKVISSKYELGEDYLLRIRTRG